ncbi:BTB/POZ domain-containing protein 9 [Thrips palmi]|uniref:BTB/POZ domain-containing protein 9 n=1 Tax=Thrips palmi TaxID=161013 RepID=A0A6P8ZRL4_THRPL|nr:BTB/POZ domain-containing protein 9 [Thrips palmi]
MSSNHHMGRVAPNGEIEHTTFLSDHIGALYLNDEYSDVVLTVDGQRFYGHKVILAACSEYFRALLFGGLRESKQAEIELKGTNLHAFKALLKYIYTGHMSLANQKEEVILETLGLAHQYGFVDLESSIADYLRQILQIRNVCMIYDAARLYELQFLIRVCCSFMDKNAQEIIKHESFLHLSPTGLKALIERDSFYAREVEIFQAVVEWVRANQADCIDNGSIYSSHDGSEDSGESSALTAASAAVMSAVRLPLISLTELLTVVRPTNLVSPGTILDAIAVRNQGRDTELRYRGCLMPEENMAHPTHGTQVVQGGMRSALLDGDSKNYDMERGYTRHAINEEGDEGILIKLGRECILNHFKMLLWDKDMRSYQYYIEVSMDQKDWVRVIDHTLYFCRSWQFLYFEPRVIQYIRIVGTNNTVNKVFHVVSFEAMFTNTPFVLEKGLIVPKHNVATVEKSASVIEGVSRSRNTLLNGNTNNYDWDSGYTCHQLGSGSILIQLGQPYMLDSMRLLLWDCDDRSYGFYVETTINFRDWELTIDKTRESCRSWMTLHFDRRPVVGIRIVGTHNTANEVFHCVHFECPAQTDDNRQQHADCSKFGNHRGGPSHSRDAIPSTSAPTETASEAGEIHSNDRRSPSNIGTASLALLRPSTARAADFAGLGAVGGVGAGVALGAEAFDVLDDGGAPSVPSRPKRFSHSSDFQDRGGPSGGAGGSCL